MSKFDEFYTSHGNKVWTKYGQEYTGSLTQWHGSFGGQCVSLIMTYLRYLYGDKVHASYGNAIDFWTNRGSNGIFELCSSVTSAQNGDIIMSSGSLPQYGHIWIYKDRMALSQNVLDDPRDRLYPMSWQGKIYGILRPKTLTPKTVPTPKPIVKEKDGSVYSVYWLYNASNGDHLYTIDHSEALVCQKEGWKDE